MRTGTTKIESTTGPAAALGGGSGGGSGTGGPLLCEGIFIAPESHYVPSRMCGAARSTELIGLEVRRLGLRSLTRVAAANAHTYEQSMQGNASLVKRTRVPDGKVI